MKRMIVWGFVFLVCYPYSDQTKANVNKYLLSLCMRCHANEVLKSISSRFGSVHFAVKILRLQERAPFESFNNWNKMKWISHFTRLHFYNMRTHKHLWNILFHFSFLSSLCCSVELFKFHSISFFIILSFAFE